MGLRIVIDDAIAWYREAFGDLGTLRPIAGTKIDRAALEGADVLITRSVTRVDDALLEGSSLRFVGSATAGIDHIDRAALDARGIAFAHAPGCNAQAVAEYVVAALAFGRSCRTGEPPGPVGVVGLGHVGRRVARALRALGYDVMACDPPLAEQRARGDLPSDHDHGLVNLARFERLGELGPLLESSFVITLHVPLVDHGPHATHHLIGQRELLRLRHGQLLINTSRGGVVDEAALRTWLSQGQGKAFLDVWEHEPRVDPRLVEPPTAVQLATPHVAGYTLEGKLRATRLVHDALCEFLDRPPTFDGADVLREAGSIELVADGPGARDDWRPWVGQAIHLHDDDMRLRQLLRRPRSEHGRGFEQLRRGYTLRRELSAFRVRAESLAPTTRAQLEALGMRVD